MKKYIVSLLFLIPLLTGCTNIDTMVTINDNRSASVVSTLSYKGDLSDKSNSTALTVLKNYNQFLSSEYKTERKYNSKKSTITATKSVKDLKWQDLDLTSLGFKSNLPDGKFIEIKKNLLMTSFNINMTYDLSSQMQKIKKVEPVKHNFTPKGLTPEYYQKYINPADVEGSVAVGTREDFMDNLDETAKQLNKEAMQDSDKNSTTNKEESSPTVTFSIKVPTIASTNNADNSDGNVYTWNIRKDNPTNIHLQYLKYSGITITLLILFCIGLLILIAKKIKKHDMQKRIDN